MEYNIFGQVSFYVDFDIEANSEEEAIELANSKLMDYYNLNVVNADHDKETVRINISAGEYGED